MAPAKYYPRTPNPADPHLLSHLAPPSGGPERRPLDVYEVSERDRRVVLHIDTGPGQIDAGVDVAVLAVHPHLVHPLADVVGLADSHRAGGEHLDECEAVLLHGAAHR